MNVMNKIIKLIKRYTCNHDFKPIKINEDCDTDENAVRKYAEFECVKCGFKRKGTISFERV